MEQPQSEFIKDFDSYLKSKTHIDKADREIAISMLRKRISELQVVEYIDGDCLSCGVPTHYRPSLAHQQHGDRFFLKLKAALIGGLEVRGYSQYKVNGYPLNTVLRYLCPDCGSKASEMYESYAKEQDAENERQRERQEAYKHNKNQAIISGNVSATPSKAFYLTRESITEEDFEKLGAMPYGEFLQTRYWDIVRKYAYYRASYKCSLCSAQKQLHAHHKHYKNHPREIFHMDDLIVLCEDCHERHHEVA